MKSECPQGRDIDVLQFRVVGPRGFETVIDPLFAELLFWAKWKRQRRLHLSPCKYPHLSSLGPLPVGFGGALGGIVHRSKLLSALQMIYERDSTDSTNGFSVDDEAFASLLRSRIAKSICIILYGDEGVWQDYTRPAIAGSSPLGCGWFVAWAERRRQKLAMGKGTLLELECSLQALARHLGEADTFGMVGSAANVFKDGLSPLDACAFGHLAVLYSIPCEPDSALHKILTSFPTLAQYLDRIEIRLGAWPDTRTFLAALRPLERTAAAAAMLSDPSPGAASSSDRVAPRWPPWRASPASSTPSTEGNQNSAATVKLHWWQVWGWSWSSRIRPPPLRTRSQKPPTWYCPAFTAAAGICITSALLSGWGPVPPAVFAAAFRRIIPSSGASNLEAQRV